LSVLKSIATAFWVEICCICMYGVRKSNVNLVVDNLLNSVYPVHHVS
jgi:hypothetical protein